MHDSKCVSIPKNTSQKLSNLCCNDEMLYYTCQSASGSLLYVAKETPPDTAFVVDFLCQYCSSALKMLWVAAKRVMRWDHKNKNEIF